MTARQEKLERTRKHLTDIPANASLADMRASVLAAIGGMNDLIRQEQGLPIDISPRRDFTVGLSQLIKDMQESVAHNERKLNGVLS